MAWVRLGWGGGAKDGLGYPWGWWYLVWVEVEELWMGWGVYIWGEVTWGSLGVR